MRIFILIFCLSINTFSFAQRTTQEIETRKRLSELVSERRERFEQFQTAIENKTGIFGNQTKKDLREANDILMDVVKTDNRIILELQRLLDYKSYEKTSENYSSGANEAKLQQYLVAIDNLNNKNQSLQHEVLRLEKKQQRTLILLWIVGIGSLLLLLFQYLKRSPKQKPISDH